MFTAIYREFNHVICFFKNNFQGTFEKGTMSAVKNTCNALGLQHASEEVICLNSESTEVERILSRVKDVPFPLLLLTS